MTGAVSGPSWSRLAASSGGPLTAARRHWRLEAAEPAAGLWSHPLHGDVVTSDACEIAHPDSGRRSPVSSAGGLEGLVGVVSDVLVRR